MARKLSKIKKLRKTGKKEGKLAGREDKMLETLMKLSAKYGLYTCALPFEVLEELRHEAANAGYLMKDGCVSWALPEPEAEEGAADAVIGRRSSSSCCCLIISFRIKPLLFSALVFCCVFGFGIIYMIIWDFHKKDDFTLRFYSYVSFVYLFYAFDDLKRRL